MKSGERRERTVDVPDTKRSVAATFHRRVYPSLFCSFTAWLPVRKRLLHYRFSYFASIVSFPIPFSYTLSLFPFIFPFTPSTSLTHCSLFRVPVFPVFTFGTGFAFQPVNKRILYETILSTFCFCILLVGAECAGNAGNHLE